jgi:V/A-type H+-transporting ATPase subunit E
MVQTIESFVAKLQEEGIEAGRQEAQRILQEAQQEAQQSLDQANQEAQRIIEQAKGQAQRSLERCRMELQLACRDAVLRLRDALGKALRAILAQHVGRELSDPQFLRQALHELVQLYAQADLEHRGFELNVPPQLRDKLSEWALREISQQSEDGSHRSVQLKGALKQAGFEYRVNGATIEVTLESVVEMLSELISPRLRQVLEEASGQLGKEP